ncbi:MAG: tetraacyldisaccharide 4'-kinase [bacterium]|nr:tetraacyldisaccharide 4'-kinase [bacterium]
MGNLTVGGNGKTPFVILLAKLLQERYPLLQEQNAIAVLSRGYGRKSRKMVVVEEHSAWQQSGDEPLLIKRSVPSTLVISHANRVESAEFAVKTYGARLIILDDGFQHRPLVRDIDFVLLDADEPLGNGRLLPAGTLREPAESLSRATVLVSVGRGSAVEPISHRFGLPLFHVEPLPLTKSWGQSVHGPAYLVTGVARPERVVRLLTEAGITTIGHRAFRDHHKFTVSELSRLDFDARILGAKAILTTSKDALRMFSYCGCLPLVVIPYDLRLLDSSSLHTMLAKNLDYHLSSRT